MVPLGAVPERLRAAVARILSDWGYSWDDLTFAGTATLPPGAHWGLESGAEEVWVLAVTVGPLSVGDVLESAGGRGAGIGLSAFSGGVIPVTPYQARLYECLGRKGGGARPNERPEPQVPTPADTCKAKGRGC